MPHESTVQHGTIEPESRWFARSRSIVQAASPISFPPPSPIEIIRARTKSTVPHLKAETPKTLTHAIDVLDEEDQNNIIKKLIK